MFGTVRVVDIILKDAMQSKLVYLRLFCLIAIAYTSAIIYGINIRTSKVECYICRPKEICQFNVVIATLGRFIWSKLYWIISNYVLIG